MRYIRCIIFILLFILHQNHSGYQGANPAPMVYHIPPHQLGEQENSFYAYLIKKAIKKAEENRVHLMIIEIDTLGGELTATLQIEKLLRQTNVRSICFINKNALSAGSLIALSCDQLFMTKDSRIGAATPVQYSSKGMQKAPEKIISASRAIWRSAAERNGKNSDITEAFVDENTVLTYKKHGISKPKGQLLTLTAQQAQRLKIADGIVVDISSILDKEGISHKNVHQLVITVWDRLLQFSLNPVIAGAILLLGFLGILYELKVPNWGISGSMGLIFIALYFIPRILVGYAGWGSPSLFLLGLFFMVLEIFVIPGFGVSGLLGIFSVMGSIAWSYSINNLVAGLWFTSIVVIVVAFASFLLITRFKKREPNKNSLILSETLQSHSNQVKPEYELLIGKQGISMSILRPSGRIKVNNILFDAYSNGVYIPKDTLVKVISYQGSQLIVESDTSLDT